VFHTRNLATRTYALLLTAWSSAGAAGPIGLVDSVAHGEMSWAAGSCERWDTIGDEAGPRRFTKRDYHEYTEQPAKTACTLGKR
jgi:hypothetical protein